MKEDRALFAYLIFVVFFVAAILTSPFWAFGTSTYTDKFGLEMPAQGDVGWDDAFRVNHKIFEVAIMPVLEGNLVFSGATPSDGGGLILSWNAGWIKFSGVSKYLPSGVTTLANNTMSWLSAVTASVTTGATIQARLTEYDIPSGSSGFAHVPIAVAWTEAGDIVRLKDIRYMPRPKYNMNQDADSGASPTFAKVYTTNDIDARLINARGNVTFYAAENPAPTAQGQAAYSTNQKALVGGDGTNTRVWALSGATLQWTIADPDALSNATSYVIGYNESGTTFIINNIKLRSKDSGVSVGLKSGVSPECADYANASNTTIAGVAHINTPSGQSNYTLTPTAGTTTVKPNAPFIMYFGGGSTERLNITLGGYLVGNKAW